MADIGRAVEREIYTGELRVAALSRQNGLFATLQL